MYISEVVYDFPNLRSIPNKVCLLDTYCYGLPVRNLLIGVTNLTCTVTLCGTWCCGLYEEG